MSEGGLIIIGDCVEVMHDMEPDSIDAIVTDPPYGLEFMGKKWDKIGTPLEFQQWTQHWGEAALRIVKPGAHALVFGGTRTHHRMMSGLEDAGWEVRDCMMWLYGQGFPKSMNVGKALMNKGETAEGWEGWGTALKPAWEAIAVLRKPLIGTVAKNVLEHGTGGINIEETRIGTNKDVPASPRRAEQNAAYGDLSKDPGTGSGWDKDTGRWPANVIFDPEAGAMLDGQTGTLTSGKAAPGGHKRSHENMAEGSAVYGGGRGISGTSTTDSAGTLYGDSGGASRFFYCAKASNAEKPWDKGDKGAHPTIKPLALMRYLVRLVTPPSGMVLDPFAGTGTTSEAALLEGFAYTLIEQEAEYARFVRTRIARNNGKFTMTVHDSL